VLAATALAALTVPQARAQVYESVSGQGTWETTLQGRDLDGNAANGFEAYYDTALDITWLADANFARTSGYTSEANGGLIPYSTYGYDVKWTDGSMGWNAAETWVTELNVNGVTGWRLPVVNDVGGVGCRGFVDVGFNTVCGLNVDPNLSELAHLDHVALGNVSAVDPVSGLIPDGYALKNTGPFINFQDEYIGYWASSEDSHRSFYAWSFSTSGALQQLEGKDQGYRVLAVHAGDVASPVPEPQTYALALVGLATVVVARKRRHA
jgi:hypothetical protein